MDKKVLYAIGGIGAAAVIVIILSILMLLGTYNNIVTLEQNVNEKWGNVEAQYQRRVDLIPNIVNTVQGVGDFEAETLTELSRLRTQWQTRPEQRVDTANQIESTLSKLLLVAENYPTLQATQAYRDLIVELEGTENRVSFARQEFNSAVKQYNTSIKVIPGNFIAGLSGFTEKEFFEALTLGAENAPTVDFG